MTATYKPTYDLFRTRAAAARDAVRRNRAARANGSRRRYVVLLHTRPTSTGARLYTVMYREAAR